MPTLTNKGALKQPDLPDERPIDFIMNWFAERRQFARLADRILVLLSETGSGKSTMLPPEFYRRFFATTRRNICCTQPRVLTTIQIAEKVAFWNPELRLGDTLGYQTSIIAKRPQRGVVYMTIGTLQQQLAIMDDESFIRKYSVIFLDEVHERSISMDFTMLALQQLLQRNIGNPQCPFLVVMSATFDAERFAKYLIKDNYKSSIVRVAGLSFDVAMNWRDDVQNIYKETAECALQVHARAIEPADALERDILIFIAGAADTRKIMTVLQREFTVLQRAGAALFAVISLDSVAVRKQDAEYNAVFARIDDLRVDDRARIAETGHRVARRIIIATNVAETGITIDSLKYVIDTGYVRAAEYNPEYGVELIARRPITRGMWQQRRGRAGRQAPGEAFSMYSQSTLALLDDDQAPEIQRMRSVESLLGMAIDQVDPARTYLTRSVLESLQNKEFMQRMRTHSFNPYALDLLDLPSADMMHDALDRLFRLGAMRENGVLTELGFVMGHFRKISLEFVRMILVGFAWDLPVIDLCTIAALANTNTSVFARNYDPRYVSWAWNKNGNARALQCACDFLELAVLWDCWERKCKELDIAGARAWAERVGVNIDALRDASELRDEIVRTCMRLGFNPYKNHKSMLFARTADDVDDWINSMKMAVWEGFKCNIIYDNTVLRNGMRVNMRMPAWCKHRVAHMVFSKITWITGANTTAVPHLLSAMDGFVPFDEKFDY